MITNKGIDGGNAFDWGKTSDDYAKFRDIYPALFYQKIVDMGLCIKGQRVLDLGTGTGVFRVIFTNTVQNLSVRIFPRIRLNRLGVSRKKRA